MDCKTPTELATGPFWASTGHNDNWTITKALANPRYDLVFIIFRFRSGWLTDPPEQLVLGRCTDDQALLQQSLEGRSGQKHIEEDLTALCSPSKVATILSYFAHVCLGPACPPCAVSTTRFRSRDSRWQFSWATTLVSGSNNRCYVRPIRIATRIVHLRKK